MSGLRSCLGTNATQRANRHGISNRQVSNFLIAKTKYRSALVIPKNTVVWSPRLSSRVHECRAYSERPISATMRSSHALFCCCALAYTLRLVNVYEVASADREKWSSVHYCSLSELLFQHSLTLSTSRFHIQALIERTPSV